MGNLAVFWPHHAQKTAFFSKIRFNVSCDANTEFSHGVSNIFGINPYIESVFGSNPSLLGVDWIEIQLNFQPRNDHARRVGGRVGVCMGSKKCIFFEKKIMFGNDPKRPPKSSKRLPTSSKSLFPGPTVHSSELAPPSGPKPRIHENVMK